MDDVARSALPDRHLERIEDQLGAQVVRGGPAHDPAAPGVQHDREVEEAGRRGDERDVRHP
jgi:hypothetical protein